MKPGIHRYLSGKCGKIPEDARVVFPLDLADFKSHAAGNMDHMSTSQEGMYRRCEGKRIPSGVNFQHQSPLFCLELKLSYLAIPMMQRKPQGFKCPFMQLGTTKRWSDSKAAIDGLADMRHVDEGGAAAYIVADDKEMFRLMPQIIRSKLRPFSLAQKLHG